MGFKAVVEQDANALIAWIQRNPKGGATCALVVGLILGRLVLVHLL